MGDALILILVMIGDQDGRKGMSYQIVAIRQLPCALDRPLSTLDLVCNMYHDVHALPCGGKTDSRHVAPGLLGDPVIPVHGIGSAACQSDRCLAPWLDGSDDEVMRNRPWNLVALQWKGIIRKLGSRDVDANGQDETSLMMSKLQPYVPVSLRRRQSRLCRAKLNDV